MNENPEIKVPPIAGMGDRGTADDGKLLAYQTPRELEIPEGWTSAEVFTLAPEKLASYISLVVAFRLAAFLVMTVTVFFIFLLVFKPDDFHRWLANMLILASMLLSMQAVTLWRQWIRAKKTWGGYKLVVADQGLLQNTPGEPPLMIHAEEIRRVTEEWDAFRVWVGRRCVILPKRVGDLDRLRARLHAKWPIARGTGGGRTIANIVFSLLMIVVMLAALGGSMLPTGKGVKIGCLVVVMAWSGWCIWRVTRIVNMPVVTKVMSMVMTGFMILYAAGRVVFVLLHGR